MLGLLCRVLAHYQLPPHAIIEEIGRKEVKTMVDKIIMLLLAIDILIVALKLLIPYGAKKSL